MTKTEKFVDAIRWISMAYKREIIVFGIIQDDVMSDCYLVTFEGFLLPTLIEWEDVVERLGFNPDNLVKSANISHLN
jgi:hypothetical protein